MHVQPPLREAIDAVAARHGAHVIEIVLRGDPRRPVLQVFIDTETGVSVDRCSEVSRDLIAAIDAGRMLPGGQYRLEVSSPGIERPLLHAWQYPKHVGRKIRITVRTEGGTERHDGRLESAGADGIVVRVEKIAGELRVPFADIVEARVLPPW